MGEYNNFFPRPTMDDFLRGVDLRSLKELSEADVMEAINSACDFFGIPYPVFVQDLSNFKFGSTMFSNIDPTSLGDDILYYNMRELAQLHVGSKEAFSLIMTHECAHRYLQSIQFKGPNYGSWQNELAADFLMGCRAGLFGMSEIDNVIDGLVKTSASKTHPKGIRRADFIKHGIVIANQLRNRFRSIAIPDLLVEYAKHYQEMLPYIKKDEKEVYSFLERRMR